MNVTIVICTFNRPKLLEKCLSQIYSLVIPNNIEILVVDNNSNKETYKVAESFIKSNNLKYIREGNQGLSYARNKAISKVETKWISYIDDDVLIDQNWLNVLVKEIQNEGIHMFGGPYYPYYDRKSLFYYNELGSSYYSLPFEKDQLLEDEYLCGGNMTIRSDVLKKPLYFDIGYGKKGKEDFYGEEVLFQIEMDKLGYIRKYVHGLSVKHFVPYEKQKLIWLLRDVNKRAKSNLAIYNNYSIKRSSKFYKRLNLTLAQKLFYIIIKLYSKFVYKFWKINYGIR